MHTTNTDSNAQRAQLLGSGLHGGRLVSVLLMGFLLAVTGCDDRAKPLPAIDERYKVSVLWKQPATQGVFFAQNYRILGNAENAWDESHTFSLGGFNAKGDPTRYSFSRVVTGTVGQAVRQALEPQPFQVHGKAVVCSICGHDRFKRGDYILLLTMHTLICAQCDHVEFFKNEPESV